MAVLLAIIYVSFVSLGLPDGLLGSAWPVMSGDFGVPVAIAGIVSMFVAGGTIVSSLCSSSVIRRYGTGMVTAVSTLLTALAMMGIALSDSFVLLCLFALPLGLGAGSVDTALNNFVALHYKAHHMNWLHCFWGLGASAGPLIMSLYLAGKGGWKLGYWTVGGIQALLVAGLFAALPLWRKAESGCNGESGAEKTPIFTAIKTRGVKSAMLCFFAYCALESATGLWGSSYLVGVRGLSPDVAAQWVSLFYIGITAGRFIAGFISFKLSNILMIRLGAALLLGGLLAVLILGNDTVQIGFAMIGLGCAPIFPGMIHETPVRFGSADSQKVVGLQMASAYAGGTFIPPLFGAVAGLFGIWLFPFYLLAMLALFAAVFENLNRLTVKRPVINAESRQ